MWKKVYEKTVQGITTEEVWHAWTDINNWPLWHSDLDYCKMEGSFAVGNFFWLKPKTMKQVKIEITAIDKGTSFTDCTSFFGAKMYDTHAVKQTADGLKITNTLVVTGPLSFLWIRLVAQHVAETIPDETEALITYIRGTRHG